MMKLIMRFVCHFVRPPNLLTYAGHPSVVCTAKRVSIAVGTCKRPNKRDEIIHGFWLRFRGGEGVSEQGGGGRGKN
jgi:hypothetical protein